MKRVLRYIGIFLYYGIGIFVVRELISLAYRPVGFPGESPLQIAAGVSVIALLAVLLHMARDRSRARRQRLALYVREGEQGYRWLPVDAPAPDPRRSPELGPGDTHPRP